MIDYLSQIDEMLVSLGFERTADGKAFVVPESWMPALAPVLGSGRNYMRPSAVMIAVQYLEARGMHDEDAKRSAP